MACVECADLVHKFMPNPESDADKSRKASMLTSCQDNSTCRIAYERCADTAAAATTAATPFSLADCSRTFEACAQPCIMDTNVTAHIDSWCSGLTELSSMRDLRGNDTETVNTACRKFVEEHYVFDQMHHTFDNAEDAMEYICGNEGLAFKPRWNTCKPKIQGIRIDGCTAIVNGTIDDTPVSWNVVKTSHCHENSLKFVGHTHLK